MDQLLRAAEEALRGIARGYSADLPPIDAIAPHLDGNTVELTLADGQQFRLMLRGRDNLLPPERVGFDAALLAMWDRLRATGNFSVSRQVQRQRWQDEVRADPEIGGPNHRRAMDRIHGLIGNYTNGAERHDLLGLFSETGVGDNPTFLRFLHRVATERDAERERLHRAMELAVRPPVFGVDRAAREDRSSIWEVRWGPHQPGEIAPEMAAFEVDQHHVPVFRAGEIAAAMTATEVQARQREAEGRLGSIHIKNWQYFCRIANIDTTTAGLAGATPPDLFALMNKARQDLMEEQLEAIRRSMMDAMLYGSAPAPLGAASAREAADRGMALLKSWLSPEQFRKFEREHQFDVIGNATRRRYRIIEGRVQNVFLLDARGNIEHGLCFAPSGDLVAGDVMLAQKIALETDEESALRVANRFDDVCWRASWGDLAPGLEPVAVVHTQLPAGTWRRIMI